MPSHDLRYRVWMDSLRIVGHGLLSAAYRFRIEGREHLPARGPALVVQNHVAFHDWLVVGVALGRPVRFVMHQHHFKYPALRAFFEASRVIPIAPRKEDSSRRDAALDAIDEALADGELVVLCPEGTMTPDGELGVFRPGIERILARRPVPVIPVGITGLWGSTFSRAHGAPMSRFSGRLHEPVTVRIGAPIAPADASLARCRDAVAALIGVSTAPAAVRATTQHA